MRGPALDLSLEDWRHVLDVNLTATFLLSQAAARRFVAQGDGGFAPGPPTSPLGSETREILAWAGFAAPQVERLVTGGAVTPRPT